ncbi:MAG: M42 family metallopeptidase [Lachnospiraceae bacterium]|nr:M42 family metallopeptidase [Lachnospiraceae bacterium]
MELLKELTQAWGVSGREKNIRAIIRREIEAYVDEMYTDALGNLIAMKRGTDSPLKKKIMLAAHMDEIGFQVKKIEGDGRIKVMKDGFIFTSAIYNDKVIFQNGVIGVVGCEGPVEEAKNDCGRLYIDIGCTSREEAEKYVKVGDYCGFIGHYYELQNERITSKSFDNRVGCYILIEAIKQNKGEGPNDVYYAFTVQEEVGCRGAITAAAQIQPDMGISVDVTPDHAAPGDSSGSNAVGNGVGVTIGNPSAILDEYLVDEMLACCEENEIKYQRDVFDRGGTDASSMNMSGSGVRVAGISIVDRFPHSQSSIISKEDVRNAIRLVDLYTKRTFDFKED